MKILLSYRRADVEAGGRVEEELARRFGADVVLAARHDIAFGQDFGLATEQAVRQCDAVLVLIGPDWLAATDSTGRRRLDDPNDPVRRDVASALKLRKTVIPVLLDGASMPRADQLPGELAPLAHRQALQGDTDSIGDVLFRMLQPPPQAPPSPMRSSAPPDLSELTRVFQRKIGSGVFGAIARVGDAVRAAGRAAGSLLPSRRKKSSSASPRAEAKSASAQARSSDPVFLGATAPRNALPGAKFSAVLSVYVESARASAQAKLERLGGRRAEPLMDIAPDRQSGWLVGAPVTVRVTASHADIEPAERRFEWSGRENLAAFSVRVHDDAPGPELDLCFHVALANVPISSIPMPVSLTAPVSGDAPRLEKLRTASSAFASYSSKDAQAVGYCLSALTRWSPGLSIFQDCLDLNPNELFKPQLTGRIGSSDVFMLFWSRHASASPWVRWEYDTARETKGLAAVLPMPLEDPRIAPPPPEFNDAHMRDRFMVARYALARIDEVAAGKHG